jgi:carboxypeptidase C (cathepsin A)
MAAESYGGRYLPVFASAVLDGNALAEERGVGAINLKSVRGLGSFLVAAGGEVTERVEPVRWGRF